MPTLVQRRYQDQEKFKTYNLEWDRLIAKSEVLNTAFIPGSRSTTLWDKGSILSEILRIEGNSSGNYFKNNEPIRAELPYFNEKLLGLEKTFRHYAQARFDSGYPRPTEWPVEIMDMKYTYEAKIDCLQKELEKLKIMLAKIVEKEEEKANDQMLQYGPEGNSRLRDGQIVEIDFMKVAVIDETFVIVEKQSPYYGMSCIDYRVNVVTPWTTQRKAWWKEIQKKRRLEYVNEGRYITKSPVYNVRINKSDLPAWPEGIKNHINGKTKDNGKK